MATWQDDLYNDYQKRRGTQTVAPVAESVKPIIRQSSKQPNKTEERFRLAYLEAWKATGEIAKFAFEAITLKVANGCRYTPDWYVWPTMNTPLENGYPMPRFYEIKARKMIWDDAIVKLKVAAALYPEYEFYLCAYDRKTGWTIERVLP